MKPDDRSTPVILILAGLLSLTAALAVGSGVTVSYPMVGVGVLGLTGRARSR